MKSTRKVLNKVDWCDKWEKGFIISSNLHYMIPSIHKPYSDIRKEMLTSQSLFITLR